MAGGNRAGYAQAEVVDQLADGLFGLLVAGRATVGGRELANSYNSRSGLCGARFFSVGACQPR
jgi:hypothetical protein